MSHRVFTGLAGLLLTIAPTVAFACSCGPATRAEILAEVPLAFQGRVESVTVSPDGATDIVRVRVTAPIQGSAGREVTVTSTRAPGLCGYPLEVGKSYDFGGKLDPASGTLPINMCTMVPLNPRKF